MSPLFEESSGNVFEDLGYTPQEAALRTVKSQLLAALAAYITRYKNQEEAARALGVRQPRISEIANGKLSAFSADLLIKLCDTAGIHLTISTDLQEPA